MKINKRAVAAGVGTMLALGLVGCSGGSGGKVSGLRDDVKHKSAISEQSHTKQVAKTKSTKSCSGTGKKKTCTTSTRPDGTKTVKVIDRHAKPALYCVELDNVNGNKDDDDRWYEVTSSVYYKMADKNEGAKVTDMKYSVTGCTQ